MRWRTTGLCWGPSMNGPAYRIVQNGTPSALRAALTCRKPPSVGDTWTASASNIASRKDAPRSWENTGSYVGAALASSAEFHEASRCCGVCVTGQPLHRWWPSSGSDRSPNPGPARTDARGPSRAPAIRMGRGACVARPAVNRRAAVMAVRMRRPGAESDLVRVAKRLSPLTADWHAP